MKKYAIIVAGGKGLRMGGELPKQFIPLGGKPVLMHTIEAFYHTDPTIQLLVVLPVEQQSYWKKLCSETGFTIPHQIVNGSDTRWGSVKNGLNQISETGYVAVHDGVRPFISAKLITTLFTSAVEHKAVIPVTELIESVRLLLPSGKSQSVDRSMYRQVQTPQVFHVALLKSAYALPYSPLFTDDASVVEQAGQSVALIEGERENIKITTPFDLQLAEILLCKCQN